MGRIIPIIPKLDYSFNLGVGTTEDVVLAKYIDAADAVSGTLEVRIHARNFGTATGALVDVMIHNVSYCPEDPSSFFVDVSRAPVDIQFGNATPTTVPALAQMVNLVAPLGSQFRAILRYTQGVNAGTATFTISAALIIRSS